ncbi:hypothetical protein IQ255_13570 [Pleurocapsales cyanobacterium LEGE 10410]|nr:hypothetical protein [Pleurocapsales cyanobacterium LEGE 10410]
MNLDNTNSTNVWDYKPRWCQPWSIMLTGIIIIASSWLILHQLWLTLAISLPILAWWVYFLILYPKAFADYIKSQQTPINLDS